MPAKKPTKWATSSPHMAQRLSKRCSKTHQHEHLLAGRPKHAADYSTELITEILKGMRDHDDAVVGSQPLEAAEKHEDMHSHVAQTISLIQDVSFTPMYRMQQQDLATQHQDLSTTFRLSDGSARRIQRNSHARENYKDEYTQDALPK